MTVIEEATAFRAELNVLERRLRDAGHSIENALRNARIAGASSAGLWRSSPPYDQAVAEVATILAAAKLAIDDLLPVIYTDCDQSGRLPMPAADITEVRVMFHDERRGREEYNPPMKKAEVTITCIVPEGADGVVALNYVDNIVRAKVREMISAPGSTEAAAAATASPAAPPPLETVSGEATAPATRHRRTKAQIEADNAAAAAASGQTASQDTSSASSEPNPADEVYAEPPAGTPLTPAERAANGLPSAEPVADEWDAGPAPEITDQELNHACSTTAERVKDPIKVRGAIALFNPGGDTFDPAKTGGRKFTVNDIPQAQRQAFLDKLKALT